MKTNKHLLLLALCMVLLIASCKKKDVPPLEQLPPATQTGENTFGCLVNGQAWTPKGNTSLVPNLYIGYFPNNGSGSFDLAAYRILSDSEREYIYFYTDSLHYQKVFSLNNPEIGTATFSKNPCFYNRDNEVYREGRLHITKLDKEKHIIAGTFEFTLARAGCDTVRVTDGRFDMKF